MSEVKVSLAPDVESFSETTQAVYGMAQAVNNMVNEGEQKHSVILFVIEEPSRIRSHFASSIADPKELIAYLEREIEIMKSAFSTPANETVQ